MEGGGGGGEKGKKSIKLFCPSVSKVVQIIAGDEQKLDIGLIGRVFGLDPNTVKLNGYYISRGVDLVASSVTWKSLIVFFSARGLSTGAADSDALLVDGKLHKIGSKRSGSVETEEQGCCRDYKKRPQHCSFVNKKMDNGLGFKRKWCLEDECHVKRTRCDEPFSGVQEREESTSRNSQFPSSIISKNLKRMRVDEMLPASPAKKIR